MFVTKTDFSQSKIKFKQQKTFRTVKTHVDKFFLKYIHKKWYNNFVMGADDE